MSIKSTKHVSRDWAIGRITEVYNLIESRNWRELEKITSEDYMSVNDAVKSIVGFTPKYLHLLTNDMLGDILDNEYIRESIFDNYLVGD